MIYLLLLTITGALSPIALMVAGIPFVDAVRFTLISHVMALAMFVVMGLCNLLS